MEEFGQALTRVREQAGLSVRAVARTSGLPPSTAGDYFSGRHLPPPTQPRLLATILRACGETDPVRLRDWDQALARVRRRPGPRSPRSRAPYRGLAPFEPQDAPWYFGREDITQTLADLAAGHSSGLPLVLVGPSGSGKSSLLRAGLIPRLTEGPVALLAPAAHPMADLAAAVAQSGADPLPGADLESRLADGGAGTTDPGLAAELAIVVDQFEGVFAECRDEGERQRFIAALSRLARRFLVVIALRADFYDRALRYPALSTALQRRQVVLPPMSRDQVRRAITEPARLEGVSVEDGLVELMLRDLAPMPGTGDQPGPAHEAGALPLLSHALLVTWEHSRGGRLTVAGYLDGGGVTQAIARTAEQVYATLDEGQQDLARRIFLRLVQVSDDALVARAPVAIADLNRGLGGAKAGELLARFVDERLISVGPETAQITHDALLTAWPRLRDWIEAGAEGLRVRRRITQAAQAWAESGEDSAALLRGGQLAIARDWAAGLGNLDDLDVAASRFLDTSIASEQASQRAERTEAVESVVFSPHQPVLATAGDDGTVRLWSVADPARPRPLAAEPDANTIVFTLAFSPDGRTLAAASADYLTTLWDVVRPAKPAKLGRPLGGLSSYAIGVAFSSRGHLLAVGSADGSIHLWNLRDLARPRHVGMLTGPSGYAYSVEFSPDGRTLAAGITDGSVWLWSLARPARPSLFATLTGPAGQVFSVAFSPDGRTIAAGSLDGTVRLWDTSLRAAASAVCADSGQPLTRKEWAAYIPGLPYRPPCRAG